MSPSRHRVVSWHPLHRSHGGRFATHRLLCLLPGHTFCRGCLMRSLDHTNRCPMCRTVLHTRSVSSAPGVVSSCLSISWPTPSFAVSCTYVRDHDLTVCQIACSARKHPISVSLQSILSKHFPAETDERRNESTEEVNHGPCVLPLFVINTNVS